MWFTTRDMNVDGKTRKMGEPVPEAAHWPNRRTYEKLRHIEWRESAGPDGTGPTPTVQPVVSSTLTPAPTNKGNKQRKR